MNNQQPGSGARGFTTVIVRSWALILGITLAAGFAALAYCWVTKPVYQATATLYVTSGTPTTASTWDGVKASQDRMATYAQLVYTDVVLSPAVEAARLDMSTQQAKSAINVVIDPLITTMTVSATDHDPLVAQRLANAVSDSLAHAVSTLEVPSSGGSPVAKLTVVNTATVDPDPVSPDPLIAVGLAVCIGLLAGVLLALTLERLNNRVRDEKDAENALGTRALATIPRGKSDSSDFTASFRLLRAMFSASTQDSAVRCLMVTSARPKEGKTTVALNIAKEFVHANNSVVLVDADLTNPELSRRIGPVPVQGLTDVLVGRVALESVLSPTRDARLAVLGAGTNTSSTDLLSSREFGKLLAELSNRFEYVIIDSVSFLDRLDAAISVATSADGVLMVAHRKTRLSDLKRVRERLEDLKVDLVGLVYCEFTKRRKNKQPANSNQPDPSSQEPPPSVEEPEPTRPVAAALHSPGTAAALDVSTNSRLERSGARAKGSHRA